MKRGIHPIFFIFIPVGLCAGTLIWAQLGTHPAPEPFDPGDPPDVAEIGIVERLDEQVPLELVFTDEDEREVPLSSYFTDGKPVILNLVYYRCPGVCNALLNGLTDTMKGIEWTAGEEFRVVTVSIDPEESAELAAAKKETYLEHYGRPQAADGWRFLVGRQDRIRALADAVGFGFRYEEGTGLFTHSAGLMICTPEGRLARYLMLDALYEPETLELALVEASEGRIGSPVQQMLLRWCYTYDPTSGEYVVAARKTMAIAGGGIIAVTLIVLGLLWRREWRMSKLKSAGETTPAAVAELQP